MSTLPPALLPCSRPTSDTSTTLTLLFQTRFFTHLRFRCITTCGSTRLYPPQCLRPLTLPTRLSLTLSILLLPLPSLLFPPKPPSILSLLPMTQAQTPRLLQVLRSTPPSPSLSTVCSSSPVHPPVPSTHSDVRVDLDQTVSDPSCSDYKSSGKHYCHFFAKHPDNISLPDPPSHFWPLWHRYTTAANNVIDFGPQVLFSPSTTPNPLQYIAGQTVSLSSTLPFVSLGPSTFKTHLLLLSFAPLPSDKWFPFPFGLILSPSVTPVAFFRQPYPPDHRPFLAGHAPDPSHNLSAATKIPFPLPFPSPSLVPYATQALHPAHFPSFPLS